MTENQNIQPNIQFTEQEGDAIRRGVFAASALVSKAEPGFIDSFREAFAGSKAMAEAPEGLREVMRGGLIMPPKAESAADLDSKMLEQTHEAMRIADGKSPDVGRSVRELIQHVTQAVASAAKNVSEKEQQMIDQILTAAKPLPMDPANNEPQGIAVDGQIQPGSTSWQQPPAQA